MILAPHELLYCYRKRTDTTQLECAEWFDLPIKQYQAIERNVKPAPEPLVDHLAKFFQEQGDITELEKCVALRRRFGEHQRVIARQLGCSLGWLKEIERGNADPSKLVEYWRKRTKNAVN